MPGLRVRIRVPYLLSQRERRKEREREPGKIHRGSLPGDPDMPRMRIAVRCGLEDLVPRRGEPRCQGDGCPALTGLFLSGGGRGDWKDTGARAGKMIASPPGAPCESLEAAMATASARFGADSPATVQHAHSRDAHMADTLPFLILYPVYAWADLDCRWYRSFMLSSVSISVVSLSSLMRINRGNLSANPAP